MNMKLGQKIEMDMKLNPNIMYYAPVTAVIALGVGLLFAGLREGEKSAPVKKPMSVEESWLKEHKDLEKNENVLAAQVLINNKLPIPAGVIVVFRKSNPTMEVAYGRIQGGNIQIENVPEGEVIVVLRPGLKSVKKTMLGIKSKNQVKREAEKTYHPGSGESMPAFRQSVYAGLSLDDRWLIEGAFSKYGRPEFDHALHMTIKSGMNECDLNFTVP